MRKFLLTGLTQALFALVLAGCGGGGSGGIATSTSNNGSGNGNGGGSQAPNAIAMTVDGGPDPSAGYDVDSPFITVTLCAPGSTSNCQVIDHVEVDTGSYGFRVMSSVLNSSLASALRQEAASDGNPIVECTMFADGFTWGPVKVANVQISGESASNIPIQVMGDPAYKQSNGATSEIPTGCSQTGTEEDTVATFGANAIIGLGVSAADCGSDCDLPATSRYNPDFYYECPSSWTAADPCFVTPVPSSAQVTNPVFLFQTDNNGVIIEFPSVAEGASTATGTLIFGIGNESNNNVTAKNVLTTDPSGDVSTTYTDQSGHQQFLPFSYFDTGSNAYYFADAAIPSVSGCSGQPGYDSQQPDSWFCPASGLKNLQATNTGQNGTESTVTFSIANAYALFNSSQSGTVFTDLGASSGTEPTACGSQSSAINSNGACAFDFGFPFFLGRTVYIAYQGATTSWGNGPYYAY